MEMDSQQLNPIIGKMRYNELSAILPDIAFPYAIVKGEVLSLYAYGDVGQRVSSDVDILVSQPSGGDGSSIDTTRIFHHNKKPP